MTRTACIAEQRREDRAAASGVVRFVLEGTEPVEFQGRLVDCSKGGFRSSHTHASLSTGQQVRFASRFGEGHALVMWNRILEQRMESGFLILDQ
jgi:hypothetical protein